MDVPINRNRDEVSNIASAEQDAFAPVALVTEQRGAGVAATRRQSRVLYVDVLRVVASLCVVFIHTSTYIWNQSAINTTNWWLAVSLNAVSRWCVPIFFMISGAFILDYRARYSTQHFFRKRLAKVLLPFVAWTSIYIIWENSTKQIQISRPQDLLHYTLSGPASYHLWFFYSLLALYLATPILSLLVQPANRRIVTLFVCLVIANNIGLPLLYKVTGISFYAQAALATPFVEYFLLGWILKDVTFNRPVRYVLYVLGALSMIVTALGSSYLSVHEGKLDYYLMDYETFTTLFASLAVYTAVKSIPWERMFRGIMARSTLNILASASLGIYLVHVMVKYYYLQITGIHEGAILFMTVGTITIFAIALIITLVLQRIPILRVLVP